jgi:hypothetical protein
MKRTALYATAAAAVVLLAFPGASLFYESSAGDACARCHEIRPAASVWRASTHRNVACKSCHGDALTLDLSFHSGNLRRVWAHLRGDIPEQIHLKGVDALKMMERCQACHRQEFAQWQAGPHSATYSRIFLDKAHNSKRLLMDDCLRCHGMFFDGAVRDLVSPVARDGPWSLKDSRLSSRPVMPCLTCHAMHREGAPMLRPAQKPAQPGPAQETFRPSLAMFDRRRGSHVTAARLPLPAMREGDRAIKMSRDQRQALCYQCHAPLEGAQAGSGDDRTPMGVHEGISCLGCHQRHAQWTRASCATCHPRLSNCGIDVEKMDTTFRDPKSKHDVHTVKCLDCHEKGVPTRRKDGTPVVRRAGLAE